MKKLITLFSFILLTVAAAAQDRYDSVIRSGHLALIPGKSNSYYSKGSKVRAQTIQKLIDKCIAFYSKKFPDVRYDFRVFVLNEDDWKLLPYQLPYGMPLSDSNNIVIPANKAAIGALFGASDNLPDSVVSDFDNIVLHELGHVFFTLNKMEIQQKWANEFIASYFAICYLQETKSTTGFPRIDETAFKPTYKSIRDFDSLYFNVGFQNYGWYEGKFIKLGYSLYPDLNVAIIREFIKSYTANKDTDAMVLIKKMSPQKLERWVAEMQ